MLLLETYVSRCSRYRQTWYWRKVYDDKTGEIKALAGVDFLTIAPTLLQELQQSTEPIPQKLNAQAAAKAEPISKISYIDNEPSFRWELLQDSMAFDKLHEGIKKFAEDGQTLKDILKQKLSA